MCVVRMVFPFSRVLFCVPTYLPVSLLPDHCPSLLLVSLRLYHCPYLHLTSLPLTSLLPALFPYFLPVGSSLSFRCPVRQMGSSLIPQCPSGPVCVIVNHKIIFSPGQLVVVPDSSVAVLLGA